MWISFETWLGKTHTVNRIKLTYLLRLILPSSIAIKDKEIIKDTDYCTKKITLEMLMFDSVVDRERELLPRTDKFKARINLRW